MLQILHIRQFFSKSRVYTRIREKQKTSIDRQPRGSPLEWISMALKLGKLDAICARLKKTSAAEQRNGVHTAITEVAPIDLRATKDTSSNSCANNNNEDTVTDLNENPSTNLVVPETDVRAQDVKSIPVPTPFAHIQPTHLTSTPISQFNASSSRRKSRKAAKPRIVAQINESELSDSEFDEHERESYGPSRYLEKNVLLHLSKEETDSMDTSDDSEGAHKGYMSYSAQLNQYSLLKQLRESEDLSVDLHSKQDGNCSSVPLDLSTNKTSDGSASSLEKSSHLSINNSQSNTADFSQNTTTDALTSAAAFSNVASPIDYPNNTEAKGLADFAENTMNELLRIYGFGGAGVEGMGKGLAGKRLGNLSVNKTLSIKTKIKLQPTSSPSTGLCLINRVSNGQSHFKDASLSASSLSSGEENSAATTPDLDQSKKTKLTESLLKSKLNILKHGGTTHKVSSSDYNKYIKKFHNGVECGGSHCRDLGYREHYHCHDCSFKAFVKKEEMVRHYKWHKKRDESMQHGFLRYSPLDDCSIKYGVCTHNGRQTHYHCMQSGCDKVYISTSDVQMHANYHRKDSAIIQEGFQRFRATEDCGTTTCSFYGQRTTHFHCRRSTCNFTFKNKADMEKHKSYHQKDEILGKDGFKKFMKYEFCNFQGCRFSKVSNHIHCIRSGCSYVLHSTAQLYSHKRKHERREFENIYRCFRQTHRSPSLPVQTGVPSATLSQPGVPSATLSQPGVPNATLSQPGQTTAVEQITQSSKDLLPTVKPAPDPQIVTSNAVSNMNQLVGTQIVKSGQVMKPVSIPLTTSQKIALPTTLQPSSSVKLTFASTPSVSSANSTATSVDNKNITSKSSHYVENDICGPPADVKIKQEPKSEDESESEEEQPLHIQMSTATEEKTYTPKTKFDLKKESQIDPVELPTSSKTVTKIERLDELKEQQAEKLPIDPNTDDSSVTINTSTNMGPMPIVPLMSAVKKLGAPEKKERDETWKTYLIRYTANDPCNSRCQLLYKDHYHCKIPGCQVLFRSKDGVREHAKFHDLQDRITPLVYDFFEDTLACPQNCQYSHKEKHYHCNWTGCTHVITVTGPTFARLEHHRIHEYARAAAGKNYRSQSGSICRNDDSLSQRRRGRPPKYPKNGIPYVPKVELSENEIKDSACQLPETNTLEDNSKIVNGFKKFEAGEQCPDPQCLYFSQKHYHCGRPRCHTATDRIDVLNLHAKDFHSFVSIMEHFEFFDRNVNCRRTHCQNNRTNRHYHCTRPRCDYSFVRHSTMNQHDKKHTTPSAPASVQSQPLLATTTRITPIQLIRHPDGQTYIPIVPAIDPQNKSIVKAAGTFYPLTALGGIPTPGIPLTTAQVGVMTSGGAQQLVPTTLTFTIPATMVTAAIPVMAQALTSTSTGTSMVPIITTGTIGTGAGPSGSTVTGAPLTVLLQQKSGNGIPQPSWSAMRNSMHYSLQASCGRPFCKLKKKDHFHCLECNQAFSDPSRLRGHISKHGVKFKKLESVTRSIRPFPVTVLNAPNLSAKVGLDISKGKEAGTVDENKESTSKETANNALENDEDDSEEDEENKEISKIPSATNLPVHLQNKVELKLVNDISEINEEAPLVIDEETNDSYDDEDANSHIDQSMDDSLDITEMSNDFETSLSPVNFSSETKERGGKIPLCSRRSSRKRTATKHDDFINSDDAALAKQMKLKLNAPIPSTVPRTNKQIPEGFIRFHCSNDCYYSSCAYRHTVTHYHCVRPECGYGFSDKSRIIQHRTRHERIDKLMGEDFQQYRATVSCHQCDCVFSEKASHFHCCKCSFVCADSSKVLAHRKYHAKLDNIVNNGFQKFTGTEDCHIASCTYHCKQTHYHCTHKGCNHAVLGPAQMAPHKLKHACREV